ncbi:MAG: DUF1501 domain-containing protein [Verrucomicrobia bacterium]|nr:DUF1501 domain-containing protein [Verrucomicrobiota bacterium]
MKASLASRRRFLQTTACGFGSLALNALLTERAMADANPLVPRAPHFGPRAKRVIFLFMAGGPSQHDLFDNKPRLKAEEGNKPYIPFLGKEATVGLENSMSLGPMSPFAPRGQAGIVMSDLLPHLATVADDLCLVRSMSADNRSHDQATLQLHTGAFLSLRPSLGAWVSYGLGTENQNLPSFITLNPQGDSRNYGSAFLPAIHQGTKVNAKPSGPTDLPIQYLSDASAPAATQRRRLELLRSMNAGLVGRSGPDIQMEGVIQSFELAFRMQTETPRWIDLAGESQTTLDLYGVGKEPTDRNARACLLARRFAEAGVRFIQVTMDGWDHHGQIRDGLPRMCAQTDQPVTALVKDLKGRGLLQDTLVVWSGEFGRTPWSQDLSGTQPLEKHGREHQPESFCAWMAGGGVRPGLTYGTTDDYGYRVVENGVHLHDLHATILHLLGFDHEQLTFRHGGRDHRLTDVFGHVAHGILA